MKTTLLFLCGIFVSVNSFADVLVDVPSIVGKNKSEVSALIGEPGSCENTEQGEQCAYAQAELQIAFINNKADWMTVEGVDHLPFNSIAMENLGLNLGSPSSSSDYEIRWENTGGLILVSLYKGKENNSDYVFIKAFSE
ncbi:hypothetical protein [Teredinibacter sp. KSP-S5-2]|uniref:hypothetical protein n=1 Tax=Teredinibacter sp. KSP-S5-2 TaxID=3034506 RepID=UPI0029342EB8|nr:hypothetical protein [Teredinibacter sp. KSP-S5-2]WNO10281.1 hypothetical protein P5V12_03755 [Teredinibacter sp. KSP-S5-2]